MTRNSSDSRALKTSARLVLAQKHPNDPVYWGQAHRWIGGKQIDFPPYMQDIMRDPHSFKVIQKGSQIGMSEVAVTIALHAAATGSNVLYLLPTAERAQDFSQTRIGMAIAASPTLSRMVGPTDELPRAPDNLRVRRIGEGFLHTLGGTDPSRIRGLPMDLVIFDEADEIDESMIHEGRQRIAASKEPRIIMLSTPTNSATGINNWFQQSDRNFYWVNCSMCSESQPLSWEANVRETGELSCRACGGGIDVGARGEWRPELAGNPYRGYALSRLYSPRANFERMRFEASDPALQARIAFFNGVLGLPYDPPGGSISIAELDAARRDYLAQDQTAKFRVMGVDQGASVHYVIRGAERDARPLCAAGIVPRIADLDEIITRFGVEVVVIDAQPSQGEALDLVARFKGSCVQVYVAYYSQPGDVRMSVNRGKRQVNIPRTLALDGLYAGLRAGRLSLPRDARELGGRMYEGMGDYYRQLMAPKRQLTANAAGEPVYGYTGRNDHFAHAEVYCQAAADRRLRPMPARVSGAFGYMGPDGETIPWPDR